MDFGFFPVEVATIKELTPSFRRFTFVGESLSDFGDPGFDQRIKVVFPLALSGGGRDPFLPVSLEAMPRGEDWYMKWREAEVSSRPVFRTYTTRAVRRAESFGRDEVDVDMVAHEVSGPASFWISQARIGDKVLLFAPRRKATGAFLGMDFVPPRSVGRLLLAGDETAAPAIARILEMTDPQIPASVVLEVPFSDDVTYLPRRENVDLRVGFRGVTGEGVTTGDRGVFLVEETKKLVDHLIPPGCVCAVKEIDLDSELLWEVPRTARGGAALERADVYAWLAGEAGSVTRLRRHLVSEHGVDRRAVAFMGYWKLGRAEN